MGGCLPHSSTYYWNIYAYIYIYTCILIQPRMLHEYILKYIYIVYILYYIDYFQLYIYININIIPEEPWKCSVPLTFGRLVTIFFSQGAFCFDKICKTSHKYHKVTIYDCKTCSPNPSLKPSVCHSHVLHRLKTPFSGNTCG